MRLFVKRISEFTIRPFRLKRGMPVNVLNLPGLRVLDFKETDTDYHEKAQPTVVSKLCPHCGRSNAKAAPTPIMTACTWPRCSAIQRSCLGF